jgi:hypothetical protein
MKKLPKLSTMRNKCDSLLTPIIKLMYPSSMFGGKTEVFHHFVHKSKSSRLRYELDNGIPLTNAQHQALHHNESYWSAKIVEIKGIEWFQKLDRMKQEYVKTDVHFYIKNYERLEKILLELNNKKFNE